MIILKIIYKKYIKSRFWRPLSLSLSYFNNLLIYLINRKKFAL